MRGPIPAWDHHRLHPSEPRPVLAQVLQCDCPASGCADRHFAGRDFASPATSSVNHSRDNLPGETPHGLEFFSCFVWKKKLNSTAVVRNRSLSL